MFSMFRRFWKSMLKREPVDALEPVRPRVAPSPQAMAELERRRAALSYQPETAFHSSTFVRKAQ